MEKMKFKSGDIVRIPLPKKLGFAYAQCIDLLELNKNARYPVLIRVFNYRSDVELKSVESLANRELILSPLLVAGINQVLSKGIWKIIGNITVKDEDKIIPHYKKPEPNELNPSEWYYLVDADVLKKMKSNEENVRHLEMIGAVGGELVATKIAMALIQDEGKNIGDYFELKEYFERVFYQAVTSIPAYYKMPEKMRGKAIA